MRISLIVSFLGIRRELSQEHSLINPGSSNQQGLGRYSLMKSEISALLYRGKSFLLLKTRKLEESEKTPAEERKPVSSLRRTKTFEIKSEGENFEKIPFKYIRET